MPRALIGTSGYDYPHWRGAFYPEGLARKRWFEYYCGHFSAVELNATFYGSPKKETFESWESRSPGGFRFVLKGSRFITHVKRLAEPEKSLPRFFERAEPLGAKLAAVLWQLPPHFPVDAGLLERFCSALAGGPSSDVSRAVRHAFEFRDPSWFCDDVYSVLGETGATVVLADWPFQVVGPGMGARRLGGERPLVRVPHTAPWVYVRRHGPGARYGSGYTRGMVATDARWVRRWLGEGRDALVFFKKEAFDEDDRELHGADVFAFYNNDARGYAVRDASRLAQLVDHGR